MHLVVDDNLVVLDRFIVQRLRYRDTEFDALCLLKDIGKATDADVFAHYERAAAKMVLDDIDRETVFVMPDEAN